MILNRLALMKGNNNMTTRLKVVTALAVAAILGAVATTLRVGAAETINTELRPVEEFIAAKLESVSELTDAQKDKIKTLMHERLPSVQKLVRSFFAEQRALRDVARVENVDEKAIRAQATKFADALADLAVQRARLARELHGIFSAEQLEKFREQGKDVHGGIDSFLEEVGKQLAHE